VAARVDGKAPAAIAAELDLPVALVERTIAVNMPDTCNPTWLQTRARAYDAVSCLAAAADDGIATWAALDELGVPRTTAIAALKRARPQRDWSTIRGVGLRASYRCACGSLRRAQFRNPEPAGLVCLDCRRDEAGIEWDPTYDQFLANPELW
jgi:hypothetical protein